MVIAQLICLDLPVNHLRQLAVYSKLIFFDGKQFFGCFLVFFFRRFNE